MATPKDIMLGDGLDLLVVGGDFVIADATAQNKALLLLADKGDFRQTPVVGVGINRALLDDDNGELLGDIRFEFTQDGMTVRKLQLDALGNLIEEASYE